MTAASPGDGGPLSLESARRRLGSYAVPVDRTDRIPLSVSVGRVLAADATANASVPGVELAPDDVVFEAGAQIRPGDVGLLKAAGVGELLVRQRPQVGIVPTGDEVAAPEAGGDGGVETAGFTLAQYVDRWGGKVTYRNAVADDAPALRMAVQRDLTRDVVVVTGTEPGDTLRSVVAELGDLAGDGIALDPGGATGIAVVQDRPVVLLPESPVGARVAAVQLLRPLLKSFAGGPLADHPTRTATLTDPLEAASSVRSLVPVSVADGEATPLRGSDLETVTRADGWVTVPTGHDGRAAGESVAVENWDYLP